LEFKRLYFIDATRAFAILMMLQGHFIDTLLANEYRDLNNIYYGIWLYLRGITAPVFFAISGLIFTFLLIKANENGTLPLRIRKGLVRGLMLIGIGYALRIPIFRWLKGSFGTYFLVIDVLQCIGLSLILIVFVYLLTRKKILIFSIVLLSLGTLMFLCEPLYRSYSAEGIPLFFANYLTKVNGSVFTILPWFGYMTFGAFIATLFYRYLGKPKFKTIIVTGFFVVGILLVYQSTNFLQWLSTFFEYSLFSDVANFNYLFIRLGNVLMIFGSFYAIEIYMNPPIILKIGQRTLSIYVIHFILLYGSFTGLGLNQILGKNLTPFEAVFGAICFLITVSLISIYLIKANTNMYKYIIDRLHYLKSFIKSLNN
jgi:uncharacterized membrane protein